MSKQADAVKDLDEAIKLNEEYTKAYMKRAEINMVLQSYDEAVRDFERVK